MDIEDIVPKDHKYYDSFLKVTNALPSPSVVEHLELYCTPTLTQYFVLMKCEPNHYMFFAISYFGIGMSEPTDYEDAKWRYDNAIKDTKASILRQMEE